MRKIVIFDLDGTLIYTLGDLANAVNHALGRLGFEERRMEEFNRMVGNGVDKLFERALPEGEKTEENIARMRQVFLPYYKSHSHDTSKPYDGIREVLEELKGRGILLATASNKFQEGTELVVRQFFGEGLFDLVRGLRKNHHAKPHPQMLLQTLAHFGIDKKDALYVGDSDVDMMTAERAGIDVIGALWGYRPEEELAKYPHLALVKRPEEILKYAL
ncbi:MAG: HAD family hydrolase [Paludibacteraceae bacterium]|nr:HAD family hydrolase [Paludibacteraceae bacterium]